MIPSGWVYGYLYPYEGITEVVRMYVYLLLEYGVSGDHTNQLTKGPQTGPSLEVVLELLQTDSGAPIMGGKVGNHPYEGSEYKYLWGS